MIARLICLVAGRPSWPSGSRGSLLLVLAGTAVVAIGLARLGEVAAASQPKASGPAPADDEAAACTRHSVLPRAVTMIAVALGLSAVTIALGSAETPVWLSIVTWLLSLCALIGLGLTLDRLSVRDAVRAVRSLLGGEHGTEVGSVLVIAGVALVLRFFDLEVVPAFFHEDEGEMAKIALNIVSGTRYRSSGPRPNGGRPIRSTTSRRSGSGCSARRRRVRGRSRRWPAFCVPVVYAIGRLGWGPVAGAIAAWLLAVSHLHIHYSRFARASWRQRCWLRSR